MKNLIRRTTKQNENEPCSILKSDKNETCSDSKMDADAKSKCISLSLTYHNKHPSFFSRRRIDLTEQEHSSQAGLEGSTGLLFSGGGEHRGNEKRQLLFGKKCGHKGAIY